jgi:hypothetical protein
MEFPVSSSDELEQAFAVVSSSGQLLVKSLYDAGECDELDEDGYPVNFDCDYYVEDFSTRIFDGNALDNNRDGVVDEVLSLSPGFYLVYFNGTMSTRTSPGTSEGGQCDLISARSNTSRWPAESISFPKNQDNDESRASDAVVIEIEDGEHLAMTCHSYATNATEDVRAKLVIVELDSLEEFRTLRG